MIQEIVNIVTMGDQLKNILRQGRQDRQFDTNHLSFFRFKISVHFIYFIMVHMYRHVLEVFIFKAHSLNSLLSLNKRIVYIPYDRQPFYLIYILVSSVPSYHCKEKISLVFIRILYTAIIIDNSSHKNFLKVHGTN